MEAVLKGLVDLAGIFLVMIERDGKDQEWLASAWTGAEQRKSPRAGHV
jgi:hypothetical protein